MESTGNPGPDFLNLVERANISNRLPWRVTWRSVADHLHGEFLSLPEKWELDLLNEILGDRFSYWGCFLDNVRGVWAYVWIKKPEPQPALLRYWVYNYARTGSPYPKLLIRKETLPEVLDYLENSSRLGLVEIVDVIDGTYYAWEANEEDLPETPEKFVWHPVREEGL